MPDSIDWKEIVEYGDFREDVEVFGLKPLYVVSLPRKSWYVRYQDFENVYKRKLRSVWIRERYSELQQQGHTREASIQILMNETGFAYDTIRQWLRRRDRQRKK